MVKVRKGWYLIDEVDNEEERNKKEKELQLGMRQAAMIERCDNKIARRQLEIEREILEQKKCSCAQGAIHSNRREIKLTHRLADELSRQTDKVCLEMSQEKSLKSKNEDETFKKLQIKKEKKKQNYRDNLKEKLPDNHRCIQEDRIKEKNQDQNMIEQQMQKIQEKDMNIKKKKNKNAILLHSELGAALEAKKIWQKTYEKALKDKDERIIHTVAEEEAQQKKMIDKRTEIRIAEDAAINRIVRKLFDNACEKRECKEMCDKLYREEERSKWTKEIGRIALKKQHNIIDSLKEMGRQHRIIAENKAKNAAIDAAFTQYLIEERERNFEKQRKRDEAHRARNTRYDKELRETIINKEISRVMNSLERQYEICIRDKNDKTVDDEYKDFK